MENPIQKVLAAEQAAQEQIENAREAAQKTLVSAQRKARATIERNEQRTHRAVQGFEHMQNRSVTEEIHRRRRQTREKLQLHTARIDDDLDNIVDEIVEQFWPAEPDEPANCARIPEDDAAQVCLGEGLERGA